MKGGEGNGEVVRGEHVVVIDKDENAAPRSGDAGEAGGGEAGCRFGVCLSG